jgi:hypothetical protein
MTRYIQRHPVTGEVLGHYAHEHPYATEAVDDGHPDILAWAADRQREKDDYMRRKAQSNPEALLARIAELEARLTKLEGGT